MSKSLLSEPVNVDIFLPIWAVMIYILSLFYGILILFSGFNFIISGYSYEKRENAKEWLKNIVLMIIFVQSSFFLYKLAIELSASMSSGVLNMIDEHFFMLTADNLPNFGLQLILAIPYVIVLLLTVIFLALRYFIVSVGVIFFPLGLFFNFIPFLKGYGKLLLNLLLIAVFLPFFQSLILLAGSMIADIPSFQSIKILLSIVTFLCVTLLFIFLASFALSKAAFSAINSDVGKAASMVYAKISVPAPDPKADNSQKKLEDFN